MLDASISQKSGTGVRRRPLMLLDLMLLIAAIALTLVSPGIMKAIIPVESHHNWDRRQYVAHIAALIAFWWTAALVPLILSWARADLRRISRNYGYAAILASTITALFLVVRQAPAVFLLLFTAGWSPSGLFGPRLFDILEHAPTASAAAVVAVWTILALTGAGRNPTNWFERLGCLVGWIWIALAFLIMVVWYAPFTWLTTSGITW